MVKKIIKGYLPGFITGVIVCGTVSVIAMTYFPSSSTTYDNSNSGLESTNVQGAIDELYGVCTKEPTGGEQILEQVNLDKDSYECRYFYKGVNPKNYITFNNELWRIISIECDGTIKIIKQKSIGNYEWDSDWLTDWARPSSLNTYLNNTYYNNLTIDAQNMIVTHDFGIGSIQEENNDLENQIDDENSIKWSGKVGLISVSEYLRINSNDKCTSLYSNNINQSECKNTNWLFNSDNKWTISSNSSIVFYLGNGFIHYGWDSSDSYAVHAVVYLSSSIKITGGDGSQSNPYQISL